MSFSSFQDVSEALAWTLLHFLWQGLLVGLLYAAARRFAAQVAWQHRFALVSLVLMLALPMTTFYALLAGADAGAGIGAEQAAAALTASAADAAASGPAHAAQSASLHPAWATGLVAAWLFGALIVALRLFGDWRLIRSAIRHGSEPPAELSELFRKQLQRIGLSRPVRMVLTARITTPGVFGLIRPVVLLPVALAMGMPRDQLETLLIHELAHIRRGDFLGNLLAITARTLLYFHPVVHWICRDLERTRETLCDDLVVQLDVDRIKYARALSTAEVFRQQVPAPLLTATGGALTWRVRRILALDADKRRRNDRAPLLLATAAIAASIAGLNSMTPEQLSAVARPDFRAAYGALMAMATPEIAIPDRAAAIERVPLPQLPVPAADAPQAPAMPTSVPDDASAATDAAMTRAVPALETRPSAPDSLQTDPVAGDDGHIAGTSSDIETVAAMAGIEPLPPAEAVEAQASSRPRSPVASERVQPRYPRNARWAGIEGSVTVGYRIDAAGRPVDIRIISAAPAGVFEEATLDAFERWQFDPESRSEGADYAQVFDFSLGRDDASRCEVKLGSKICRR